MAWPASCCVFAMTDRELPFDPHAAARVTSTTPLWATLLGFTLIALLALTAVALPRPCGSRVEQARTDSLAILSATELYLAQDPAAPCPTVERLIDERILNGSSRTRDPWGKAFRITCGPDAIRVRSSGPDRLLGTPDDVD